MDGLAQSSCNHLGGFDAHLILDHLGSPVFKAENCSQVDMLSHNSAAFLAWQCWIVSGYFHSNRCFNGNACSFAHSHAELQDSHLMATELCFEFARKGKCSKGQAPSLTAGRSSVLHRKKGCQRPETCKLHVQSVQSRLIQSWRWRHCQKQATSSKSRKGSRWCSGRRLRKLVSAVRCPPPDCQHQVFATMGTCPYALSRRTPQFLHATHLTLNWLQWAKRLCYFGLFLSIGSSNCHP